MGVLVQVKNLRSVDLEVVRPLQTHAEDAFVKLYRTCFLVDGLILEGQLLKVLVLCLSESHLFQKLCVSVCKGVDLLLERILKLQVVPCLWRNPVIEYMDYRVIIPEAQGQLLLT